MEQEKRRRPRWKLVIVLFSILPILLGAILVLTMILVVGGGGGGKSGDTGYGEALVQIAIGEEGIQGGDKYRAWYIGSADGEAWCATFVSWCADQLGLIDAGVIPKFASCKVGISWFRSCDQWHAPGYVPTAGDLVFFDWERDGIADHIGIVTAVTDGWIHTIEGNSGNVVRSRQYPIDSPLIYGIATPLYSSYGGVSDFSGNANAEIAWNYLISKGCSETAAAGILGNLQQESNIDPEKHQMGGGPGRGIGQWGGGRLTNLKSFAANRKSEWTNLQTQLEFLWWELNGGDSTCLSLLKRNYGGLSTFLSARSLDWATEAFEKCFERAGDPMMSQRITYAESYYNLFAGG